MTYFKANVPDVSVIICTKNRAEDLRQSLVAFCHICIPANMSVEVLVVDNGSVDHTASVVRECQQFFHLPLRYTFEAEKGLSQARNRGLVESRGEILLFTDDDVRPPQDWISLMCSPIIAGKSHAVAGDVVIAPHLEQPWMQPIHRGYLAAYKGDGKEPAHMTGANMAFSREVLGQVPQFDVELGAGLLGCCEESLFSWQLKRAGYKIMAMPDAPVEHHFQQVRLKRKSFLETAKGIGRSHAYLQYHWEHTDQKHLLFRRLRKKIQILIKKQKQDNSDEEGAEAWEMQAVSHLSLLRQYTVEQKRPRNYSQYGLVKRS